jgi:MarR family transcriptional regulator, organic hydroperoxide resistance regulator
MHRQDDLPEALQFIRLLWQLDHALNKRSRRLLRVAGVTAPQRFLLKVVGMRPGCSPGQLAKFLHVTPATVTRVVQRMESAGFVRREADPEDSRRVRLHLTPRGRKVDERCSDASESPVSRVLGETARARVEETRRLLGALVEALEAE